MTLKGKAETDFWRALLRGFGYAVMLWSQVLSHAASRGRLPSDTEAPGRWGLDLRGEGRTYTKEDLPEILAHGEAPLVWPWEVGPVVFPVLAYAYEGSPTPPTAWYLVGGPDPEERGKPLSWVRLYPDLLLYRPPSGAPILLRGEDLAYPEALEGPARGLLRGLEALPMGEKPRVAEGLLRLVATLERTGAALGLHLQEGGPFPRLPSLGEVAGLLEDTQRAKA